MIVITARNPTTLRRIPFLGAIPSCFILISLSLKFAGYLCSSATLHHQARRAHAPSIADVRRTIREVNALCLALHQESNDLGVYQGQFRQIEYKVATVFSTDDLLQVRHLLAAHPPNHQERYRAGLYPALNLKQRAALEMAFEEIKLLKDRLHLA